jgi:hypothetical protein
MYVPPRYLSIFLEEDLSPRVAYETFLAAATANNNAGDCAPLLQWLRLTLTRGAVGDASTLMLVPPSVPLADRTLIQHRWSFVTRDLPVLDPTQVQHGAHYIVASIGALAQEQRTARREDQLRRVTGNNKTPGAHYGTGIRTILRLCQVGHESMLPQLYHDLAKAHPSAKSLALFRHQSTTPALRSVSTCHWSFHQAWARSSLRFLHGRCRTQTTSLLESIHLWLDTKRLPSASPSWPSSPCTRW